MAIIRIRGKILHIQWFDPFEKKIKSMSTHLEANKTNQKKVEQYAVKFQNKVTTEYRKQKQLGFINVSIKDAFDHFKKINEEKSPKTITDYIRFYKKFTETFDENLSCTSINKLNVEYWLMDIKKLSLSKNSIHAYGKQLNHFLNFLFEYNYTSIFKINREVKTRPEVKEKIVFREEDLTSILRGLEEKNINFKKAIYLLMLTGLRSSDILTIKRRGLDLENRILKYYSPKRKKFREIGMHRKLAEVLSVDLTEDPETKILNYNNVENLNRAITRYFEKIGIEKSGYTARTFRKTFITLCRSKYNIDASVVMELVGHEARNTTDRYYNKISVEKMKNELDKFQIPGEKTD